MARRFKYSRRPNLKDTRTKKSRTTGGRSLTMPKGIVDGLITAVKNQLSLGSSAAKRIASETSKSAARAQFTQRAEKTRTRPHESGAGTGMKIVKRTVPLGKPGFVAKTNDKRVSRLLNENIIKVQTDYQWMTSKFTPTSTPRFVLKKGADLSEDIPMMMFNINSRPSDVVYWHNGPDPNGFGTWASNGNITSKTHAMGQESNYFMAGEKAVFNGSNIKFLFYGTAKRQARYRVVIFRPKDTRAAPIHRYGSINVSNEFMAECMGSLMPWVRKHAVHPCATYKRDPRLEKLFRQHYDVRYDEEIVIDETQDGEDHLKTVLLNLWLPVEGGELNDYRYNDDVDLGPPLNGLENPENDDAPIQTSYTVNPLPYEKQQWHCIVLANETLDDTEISAGGYKNLGFDLSIKNYHDAFKATSNTQANVITL